LAPPTPQPPIRPSAASTTSSTAPSARTSAIFIEEDDSQNGVDHVDGHRSPGDVISPYTVLNGPTHHTYYTQFNMTRAIEQILGLPPMNQFELVATSMRDIFTNTSNTAPFNHVSPTIDLTTGANCPTAPWRRWLPPPARRLRGRRRPGRLRVAHAPT
jgi:hypothetical protein